MFGNLVPNPAPTYNAQYGMESFQYWQWQHFSYPILLCASASDSTAWEQIASDSLVSTSLSSYAKRRSPDFLF